MKFSPQDLKLITTLLQHSGLVLEAEDFARSSGSDLNSVISKPWGFEFRIYCDNLYDMWLLTLRPGCSTSFHCHPRKSTALVCLSGSGKLRFLTGAYFFGSSDIVHIEKGAFHSTSNIGENTLSLLEIEVPRNKRDLVRAEDPYGRVGRSYSTSPEKSVTVPSLVSPLLTQNAVLRERCHSGRYRFSVVRGKEIEMPTELPLRAVIKLDISRALRGEVQVLQPPIVWGSSLDDEALYVAITDERKDN